MEDQLDHEPIFANIHAHNSSAGGRFGCGDEMVWGYGGGWDGCREGNEL